MPGDLEAVVIDLDDTLVASARAARRARARLRDFGISPKRFLAADRRWWQAYLDRQVTIEELRRHRWRDLGLDEATAAAADDVYRTVARATNVRTGARRLLQALRDQGWRLAILTNGAVEHQWKKIEQAALGHLVDSVVISEGIGFRKPEREAFDAALKAVHARADTAAMVGDAFEYDVAGALAAGFRRVVWLTRQAWPAEDPRVRPVGKLADVLPALLAG